MMMPVDLVTTLVKLAHIMFLEQKHRCSPVSGLNNLMILHVRKDHTDLLNEIDVANEFVGEDYTAVWKIQIT